MSVGRSGNIAILLGAFLPIFIESDGGGGRAEGGRREGGGRAADAEGRKEGSEMKRKPSTPENSRHRDRPHKFAIVTMEVEKGGTEWNGRIGGEGRRREGGREDF